MRGGANWIPPPGRGDKEKNSLCLLKQETKAETSAVPLSFRFRGTRLRCIGRTRRGLLVLRRWAHCSEGISCGPSCRLAPTGGSLKGGNPGSCPHPGIVYVFYRSMILRDDVGIVPYAGAGRTVICGWDRNSGQTAGSGWRSGWWWCRLPGAWERVWERALQRSLPGLPRCGRSRPQRTRCRS